MPFIYEQHFSRTFVFTDAPVAERGCTVGVVIPALDFQLHHKLSRKTSSTVSELDRMREALHYSLSQSPHKWTIFRNTKSALPVLGNTMSRTRHFQLVLHAQWLFSASLELRRNIMGTSSLWYNWKQTSEWCRKCSPWLYRYHFPPPCSFDVNKSARVLGKYLKTSLWAHPDYPCPRLQWLEPHLLFRTTSSLHRHYQHYIISIIISIIIQPLILGVAYTRKYHHKKGRLTTLNCPQCDVMWLAAIFRKESTFTLGIFWATLQGDKGRCSSFSLYTTYYDALRWHPSFLLLFFL